MLAEQITPLKTCRVGVSFPWALVLPVQSNITLSCMLNVQMSGVGAYLVKYKISS